MTLVHGPLLYLAGVSKNYTVIYPFKCFVRSLAGDKGS